MHITRRAPELSATSSSVDIWIIESTPVPGGSLAHALERFPSLELGKRTALADAHDIACLVFAILAVGVICVRTAHGLAHDRMGEATLDLHHHGLRILVADHDALQHALWHYFCPSLLSLPC